jgi:hypothetical protein
MSSDYRAKGIFSDARKHGLVLAKDAAAFSVQAEDSSGETTLRRMRPANDEKADCGREGNSIMSGLQFGMAITTGGSKYEETDEEESTGPTEGEGVPVA